MICVTMETTKWSTPEEVMVKHNVYVRVQQVYINLK